MLSTLFDFPFLERRTLTCWSNVGAVNTHTVLQEMLVYFAGVWKIRLRRPLRAGNGDSAARDRVDRADAP